MGLRINSNLASLQAQRRLRETTQAFAQSMQRLSTGQRINRAGEDASGLAISQGLQAQARALRQIGRNVNDAYGFLQTAEGALQTQTDLIQRMRELALRAASGTLGADERKYLDDEFQLLVAEFDRISKTTEFNGTKLLDGTFENRSLQVGINKGQTVEFSIRSSGVSEIFDLSLEVENEEIELVGTGAFSNSDKIAQATSSSGPIAGDFNGDGQQDFATRAGLVTSVYLGNGSGKFSLAQTFVSSDVNPSIFGKTFRGADLNNDGRDDLIFTNRGVASATFESVTVFLANPDGTFSQSQTISVGNYLDDEPVLEDLNGDGFLDFVQRASSSNFIRVYLNNQDGTFALSDTLSTGISGPGETHLKDISGDGEIDLVTFNRGTDHLVVYLGDGNGGFSFGSTYSVGDLPSDLILEDFDGDDILDVAVANANTDNLSILLNNGDGTFAAGETVAVGDNPLRFMQSADFNGDGQADILTMDYSARELAIRMGNGDGTFAVGATLTAGAFWSWNEPYLADLDGDNDIDVAIGNNADKTVSILLNNGDGSFSFGTTLITTGNVTGYLLASDFNGDGVDDLAAATQFSNTVHIYLANTQNSTETSIGSTEVPFDIRTAQNAQDLLQVLDTSLATLSENRSALGATLRRLESVQAASTETMINLSAANSQTADTDIAAEMAELIRAQVLSQSASLVLAQANTSNQVALSLLQTL